MQSHSMNGKRASHKLIARLRDILGMSPEHPEDLHSAMHEIMARCA
eukprot:CAMPEP_0113687318 /NCGR_PEP_ID=MMETSP0038_2-20120614/15856_1 /TAXON_ID=2898 /ORGANISM="Cryptomonas paramecium" /LENGTH=45 /DNA_ID=CAMNT_0000607893 /DNA_START=90 /DNA_END=223 /DNA_ORIENTATION=+ /assembly_acc=CAM_ASM_000170